MAKKHEQTISVCAIDGLQNLATFSSDSQCWPSTEFWLELDAGKLDIFTEHLFIEGSHGYL